MAVPVGTRHRLFVPSRGSIGPSSMPPTSRSVIQGTDGRSSFGAPLPEDLQSVLDELRSAGKKDQDH